MAAHRHTHPHLDEEAGDRRVMWAVLVNIGLTVGQVIGGILAGSLALIADAVHNLSDAMSLGIAFAARKIARRQSDVHMTFGYARAEIVAALVNYTTLILVGVYLFYEAVLRFFSPQEVEGWLVVAVAGLALAVDAVTALLTYTLSKTSVNIRAAFLHNLADALGSIGVIAAGVLVILFGWHIVDPIVTMAIAVYILWLALSQIGGVVRILMLGVPPDIDVEEVVAAIRGVDGVEDVHHLHVWAIDEHRSSLEAHIVVPEGSAEDAQAVKARIRALARERFGVTHTTLELEAASECHEGEHARIIGHRIDAHR
ncbi:MAG: cation diffusion facilitator family transporter [Hyphomicrobiaceae bacterium]|nr:cation diffusion facilitator family transporter [Hyphomicrobiaceae bacterium]